MFWWYTSARGGKRTACGGLFFPWPDGDWTQVLRLGRKLPYLLSHLTSPLHCLLVSIFTQWKRRGHFHFLQNYGKTVSLHEHKKKTALPFKTLQEAIITYQQAMFSNKWTEWYSTSQWDLALVRKPHSDQPELDICKVARSNIKASRTPQLRKEQHLGNASFAFVKNLIAGSKEKIVSKPATWSLLWMLCTESSKFYSKISPINISLKQHRLEP